MDQQPTDLRPLPLWLDLLLAVFCALVLSAVTLVAVPFWVWAVLGFVDGPEIRLFYVAEALLAVVAAAAWFLMVRGVMRAFGDPGRHLFATGPFVGALTFVAAFVLVYLVAVDPKLGLSRRAVPGPRGSARGPG
ncbi:MAG: hypothetical protein QM621_07095 [Aeromicrobium sp.]|uniref:hypothetical protein n=1 Tax=Aeromicrobium sp. TaxID=1871063 RepID=UPI0039E46AF3